MSSFARASVIEISRNHSLLYEVAPVMLLRRETEGKQMIRLKIMPVVGAIALGACGGSPEAKTADVCQDVLGMIPAQCDCFDVNLEADFDAQTIGKTYEALGKVNEQLSLIQSMRSVELDQRTISDVLTVSERCKMDSSWGAAGSN